MILLYARDLLACFFYYYLLENRMILPLLTLIDDNDANGWFVTPINRHGTTVAATSHCCFIRPGKTNYNVYKKEKKESLLFRGVRRSRWRRWLPVRYVSFKKQKIKRRMLFFTKHTHTHTRI
jgi:hypothetical protein